MASSPRFPWLAFGALSFGLILHSLFFFGYQVDDAFIALRYADNLRHGLGPTFNPGERVEGFTSPSAIVFDALFLRLGFDGFLAAKVFGIVSGIAALGFAMWLALDLANSAAVAIAAGAILILQPQFAIGCVNGMETAFFTACVTAAIALFLVEGGGRGRGIGVSVALALAFLTRPDGALICLLIWGVALLRSRRLSLELIFPIAIIVVPLFTWKVWYFGSLAPNTAVAKLPPFSFARIASGLHYIWAYSETHWELAEYVAVAALAIIGGIRGKIVALFAFAWLTSVAYVGGDWIARARFIVPIVPLLSVAFAAAAARWKPRLGPAMAVVCALVGGACDVPMTRGWVDQTSEGTVARAKMADWLHEAAQPGSSVAALDVGILAYLSNLPVIDTGGLTDKGIARIIHDGPSIYIGHLIFPSPEASAKIARQALERKPEFIVLLLYGELPALVEEAKAKHAHHLSGGYVQDEALVNDPELRRNYTWICSNLSHLGGWTKEVRYNLFRRNDVTLRLQPRLNGEGHIACEL